MEVDEKEVSGVGKSRMEWNSEMTKEVDELL
jgi:hypothetical protein